MRTTKSDRWSTGQTRRTFLLALGTMASASSALVADGVSPAPAAPANEQLKRLVRRYRADAVVTFLGIPVISRTGVGGGYALIEQRRETSTRTMSLQFAAGSVPRRAAGLNRLGFIEEMVKREDSGVVGINYFGFMTASKEESLEEGRKALAAGPPGGGAYNVVVGGISHGEARSLRLDLNGGDSSGWATWRRLLSSVRTQTLARKVSGSPETLQTGVPQGTSTFLHTLVDEFTAQPGRSSRQFVYGKWQNRLELERRRDLSMGKSLAARSLTSCPERVMQLRGTIHDAKSGKSSRFLVWYEAGEAAALPLRFELQPRSYLHLTFEYDPAQDTSEESYTAQR